jgi:ubiquitin C-terminal hydrolase
MELETFFSCQMQCKQACKGGVIVHEFQDISDPCVVINVPVPKSTVTLHLQRLVDDLFEPEIVSMQESAAGACEGCGALERVRLSVVTHTSVGLCINLQIVQYDDDASPARTRQRTKNKVPIACPSTIELNDQVYVVRSLILHDNQHYRCIRKHRDSWFLCDDSEVTAISDSQALKPRHDISCVFAELYQ